MGAKNTYESVGKWAGAVVGLADVAKGALAVGLARYFNLAESAVLLVGAGVVLGHDFPLFLGFRGGQGMATLIGVFSVLFPYEMVVGLGVFALFFLFTRNWDLSWAVGFVLFISLLWLASGFSQRLLYIVVSLPTIALRKLIQLWQAGRIAAR
jgi:glycerol-3-phosphate acyltransferase PlsY